MKIPKQLMSIGSIVTLLFCLMAIGNTKEVKETIEVLKKEVFILDKNSLISPLPAPYTDTFSGWQKFTHTIEFPSDKEIVRVVKFQLQGSDYFMSNQSSAHMAVHLDHVYQDKINQSFGILIGNISARKDGCKTPPALQIEHFTRAWIYYNADKCKPLQANQWYDITLVTDGVSVAYWLKQGGQLLETDVARLPDEEISQYQAHGYYNVGFTMLSKVDADQIQIKNIQSGYYLADFTTVIEQINKQ